MVLCSSLHFFEVLCHLIICHSSDIQLSLAVSCHMSKSIALETLQGRSSHLVPINIYCIGVTLQLSSVLTLPMLWWHLVPEKLLLVFLQ